jgi:hypothetical protein
MKIRRFSSVENPQIFQHFESDRVFTNYSKIRLGDGRDMQYIVFNDNKILGGNKNEKIQ